MDPDPYRMLGVPSTASQAEITQAYRARLRAHHPDTRTLPASPAVDERLQQVLNAYALLRDPARRADYDRRTSASTIATPSAHVEPTTSAGPGPVDIPIKHRRSRPHSADMSPPLRVGPVRRHR